MIEVENKINCSVIYLFEQRGTFGIRMKNKLSGEVDGNCNSSVIPAHFTWKYVNTPAGLDSHIEIENITGINAINSLIWTSHEEYTRLIDRLERELSDKVLFHIVDSSMFQVDQALANREPEAELVSGTMMHTLNGTLSTTVHVHDAQYSFSIQDYLPNLLTVIGFLYSRKNEQRG